MAGRRMVIAAAGAAAGATLMILAIGGLLTSSGLNVQVTANAVMIESKQIALDRRSDTNRSALNSGEQEVVEAVLSYPHTFDVVSQKEELYIATIMQDDAETDCESDCSVIVIGWDKPSRSSLYAVVDTQNGRVVHWILDPQSGKSLG